MASWRAGPGGPFACGRRRDGRHRRPAARSGAPWCPRWWEHLEAVARLHALWLAWQELTDPRAGAVGPSVWHRDHLAPAMSELRDPAGPFAGCKEGSHRAKSTPAVEPY
ncbi:DUF4913 domain-containing protein [Streptomyces mutabilis]|uniref:DUF4913 domain-containing protein n=1 Tax=Streptomyces mutabilis TaxID=67332 RepID=UPI0033AF64C3